MYGASEEFQDQFVEQAKKKVPPSSALIYGGITKAIRTKKYVEFGQTFYNAAVIVAYFEVILGFAKKMGIDVEQNFMASYIKTMKKVPRSHGGPEIVEVYLEESEQH